MCDLFLELDWLEGMNAIDGLKNGRSMTTIHWPPH